MLLEVSHVLGTSRNIEETDSLHFYQKLQTFIDSKEKTTGDKEKDRGREPKAMEFWPLIRVVKYSKPLRQRRLLAELSLESMSSHPHSRQVLSLWISRVFMIQMLLVQQ